MSRTKTTRVLASFSYVLGGSVFSTLLEDILAAAPHLEVEYLRFRESTLAEPVPPWAAIGDTPRSAYLLHRLYRTSGLETTDFDVLVFQTYHAGIPYGSALSRTRGIMFLDSTPALDWQRLMRTSGSLFQRFRWRLGLVLGNALVKRVFAEMTFFFAWTETVKASLVSDYGVSSDRIEVTYAPVPPIGSAGSSKRRGDRPRLIFVGNDFVRKGGPFLIDLYENHLADRADLVVVSSEAQLCDGSSVELHRNITRGEVLELMQNSDILVFPSFNDAMGIVLCEALKCGLAIVSRDAGAQGELVTDGRNGRLLPYESGVIQWSAAIRKLLDDPPSLERMKTASLKMSKKIYDSERLSRRLLGLIEGEDDLI